MRVLRQFRYTKSRERRGGERGRGGEEDSTRHVEFSRPSLSLSLFHPVKRFDIWLLDDTFRHGTRFEPGAQIEISSFPRRTSFSFVPSFSSLFPETINRYPSMIFLFSRNESSKNEFERKVSFDERIWKISLADEEGRKIGWIQFKLLRDESACSGWCNAKLPG